MGVVKVRKRWLVILAIPVFIVVGLFLFIQSDFLRERMATTASDAIGSEVELGDALSIKGIFPKLRISIPNARIKTDPEGTSALQRARFENTIVSLSTSLLFGSDEPGDIDLHVERVTLISSADADSSPAASRDLDATALRPLAAALADALDQLSQVHVHASIDSIDYIARDSNSGNTRYVVKNTSLVANNEKITASANVIWEDRYQQRLNLEISELIQDLATEQHRVSGNIKFDISPTVQSYSEAKGKVTFTINDSGLNLTELDANNNWVWLRGNASGQWNTDDIELDADVEIRSLELGALANDTSESGEATAKNSKQRMFPFDLFTFALPLNVNSDIAVHLGAIRLDSTPVANGSLQLTLDEGIVSVNSEDLTLLGGDSSFSMEIDNTLAQLVVFKMKLESDDIELDRIRADDGAQTVLSRGTADAIIALQGEGPSPGHIASSLDGYVLASVENAQINQRYSTLIDRGLVSWAVEKVSLLRGNDQRDPTEIKNLSDPLTLDCASLKVYINDGRVEVSNGAILELPDNSLFSSGYIDLASEELGFAFRTQSKSLFDWSAISIIKYAELSGTLYQPKAAFNATELAKQGVKTASSAAWGPLPSIVYSLAESGLKNASNTKCNGQIK